jgi:hypothetical protein
MKGLGSHHRRSAGVSLSGLGKGLLGALSVSGGRRHNAAIDSTKTPVVVLRPAGRSKGIDAAYTPPQRDERSQSGRLPLAVAIPLVLGLALICWTVIILVALRWM